MYISFACGCVVIGSTSVFEKMNAPRGHGSFQQVNASRNGLNALTGANLSRTSVCSKRTTMHMENMIKVYSTMLTVAPK